MANLRDLLFPLVALWEWSPMTAILLAIVFLCFIYLKWWPGHTAIKHCPRPFIILPILAVLFVGIPIYGFRQFMVFLDKVPISCDCDPVAPTIILPTDGVINWLQLNEIPAQYGGGGLGKAFGPGGKEMKLSSSPHQIMYRCRVVNHGSSTIFNVDMALHLTFMETIRDSAKPGSIRLGVITLDREWPIPVPEIGVGASGMFVFYISTISPKFAFVTFPEFVTFQRPNMETQDSTRLVQPPGLKLSFPPIS